MHETRDTPQMRPGGARRRGWIAALGALALGCAAPPVAVEETRDASGPDPAYSAYDIESCLIHSHFEQCLALPEFRDSAPCNPALSPLPLLSPEARIRREDPRRDIEGWVELEAPITSAGTLGTLRVIASEPPGVFDQTAIRTFRKWRFCPKTHDHKRIRRRFHFSNGVGAAMDAESE